LTSKAQNYEFHLDMLYFAKENYDTKL
jgi:hypothetical protein